MLNSKNASKLFACFKDLKKAFDTVWHDGLFLKLQKAGIDGKLYNVIKSMYKECHSICYKCLATCTPISRRLACFTCLLGTFG